MPLSIKTTYVCGLLSLAPLFIAAPRLHAQRPASEVILTSASKSDLTTSDVSIPLKQRTAGSLRQHLEAIHANRRLYLRLSNLQAPRQPGVLYAIYLEPLGTTTRSDAARLGYLNFFAVSAGAKGNPLTFEASEVVRALLDAKPELSGLQVSIVPGGQPQSVPSIGSIELIAY